MSDKATPGRIVEAADDLFYRQGYEQTSFADIAAAVNISRGNFYYHFKSKEELLHAVIDVRLANTRRMLTRWEDECTRPVDRILCYVNILIANKALIKLYGCPVGTLSTELAKLRHALRGEANGLFDLFHSWLEKHFVLLGRKADAVALAANLIARSQGIATLANAFHDEKIIRREVRQLRQWVKSLGVKSLGVTSLAPRENAG